MFKKNKIIIFFLIIFFLILSFLSFLKVFNLDKKDEQNQNIEIYNKNATSSKIIEIQENSATSSFVKESNLSLSQKTQNKQISFSNKNVFLKIENKIIEKDFIPKESVFEFMIRLKSQDLLDFKGKEFSGLGFYVTEIDGVKEDPKNGLFWKYYINNTEANTGISNHFLNENDEITWKLTKN